MAIQSRFDLEAARRALRRLLIVGMASVATACNGVDSAPATIPKTVVVETSPAVATTVATTASPAVVESTRPPGTTSVADPDEFIPNWALLGGEPDWVAFAERVNDFQVAWFTDPPSADVGQVCAAGSPCEQDQGEQFANLAESGWRVENMIAVPVESATFESATETEGMLSVQIRVVEGTPDFAGAGTVILDRDGEIVSEMGIDPRPTETSWSVVQDESGEWKVWQFSL